MARITSLQLAAVCFLSITIPSVTALSMTEEEAQAMALFPRANTCSVAGYTPCNHNGLPDSFCCPSTSTCIPFNNRKSAICCPTGETCSVITAISCDVSQQNATLHPESQLFSTDLSGTLETCNGKCCPNGYHCDQSGQCSISNPQPHHRLLQPQLLPHLQLLHKTPPSRVHPHQQQLLQLPIPPAPLQYLPAPQLQTAPHPMRTALNLHLQLHLWGFSQGWPLA